MEMVMRNMVQNMRTLAVAATLAFGVAGLASGATIDVSGVNGTWTGATAESAGSNVTGQNTNRISWGQARSGNGQSGYGFAGSAVGLFETGTEFQIGTFTHYNRPITTGTSITGANLGLAVSIVLGGLNQAITASFNFVHNETPNQGTNGVCANGGTPGTGINSSGCADRVTILDNSASQVPFELDGVLYVLEITGFIADGQAFSEFWTRENADNSAILLARFKEVGRTTSSGGGGGGGTPSPVPLPGAAWLILSALAAMVMAGRKRQVA
jgi:hypothetical protein